MKVSGRFKSRLEANVRIGGMSPQQSWDAKRRLSHRFLQYDEPEIDIHVRP
ncbi:hypothetical protein ABIB06_002146 [Bradyrhizobium sp. LB8.2]